MASPQEIDSSFDKVVQGTFIKGEIKSGGSIKIDGKFEGNLSAQGRLVVGQTGEIEGDVTCADADISGKMTGTLKVSGQLNLKSTAVVSGEIETMKLSIETGAIFTGTCKMSTSSSTTNARAKANEKK